MPKPLTKRRKRDGRLYRRPPEIEAVIDALLVLPRTAIITRLAHRDARIEGYIPSEALVHLLRETRTDNGTAYFDLLYRELLRRIARVLPQPEIRGADGKPVRDARLESVRDAVRDRFVECLLEDRLRPGTDLDIFECRFGYAVVKMREKAWARHYREIARLHPKTVEQLEISIESGDREFAGLRDRFFSDPTSRILLYAEIDILPHPDRRILTMLIAGFQIESDKADVKTITGEIGCDCKTVWNKRDAFVARMRGKLDGGESDD
jgi:hypothetical protein